MNRIVAAGRATNRQGKISLAMKSEINWRDHLRTINAHYALHNIPECGNRIINEVLECIRKGALKND